MIDSERQPPGADLGGAGDGEHGGADNRPPGPGACRTAVSNRLGYVDVSAKKTFFAQKGERFTRFELRNKI